MSKLHPDIRTGMEYRATAFTDAITLIRRYYERYGYSPILSPEAHRTFMGIIRVLQKERRETRRLLEEDDTLRGGR